MRTEVTKNWFLDVWENEPGIPPRLESKYNDIDNIEVTDKNELLVERYDPFNGTTRIKISMVALRVLLAAHEKWAANATSAANDAVKPGKI